MDCNCSMRTTQDSSIKIELLEFDLESSSSDDNNLADLINSKNSNTAGSKSKLQKKQTDNIIRPLENVQLCLRDYFQINSYNPLCGTLNQFSSIIDVQKDKNNQFSVTDMHQITNFRFLSDDALTRRGFWIKIKVSSANAYCPANFVLIDNMCLRVYDESLTWYEAHNYCSKFGYSLALIENFELEKKMNKILFDNDDFVLKSLFGLNQTHSLKTGSKNFKSFWTGIRHLNTTNWFDSKNNLLNLRTDEQKWWPWLIVDSKTYSHGSCVGKRRNWFFLEDCYKRMPFACQTNKLFLNEKMNKQSDDRIQFKCGKMAGFSSLTTSLSTHSTIKTTENFLTTTTPAIKSASQSTEATKLKISKTNAYNPVTNSTHFDKIEIMSELSSNEVNLALFTVKKNAPSPSLINSNNNDSSKQK